MIDLLSKHFDLILTGLGSGLVGWIFERKRKKAETEKVETDVLAAIQQNYATLVKDMNEKYKEQDTRIDALTKKVFTLESEVIEWKGKYFDLKQQIEHQ